jgi:hypothetical protein
LVAKFSDTKGHDWLVEINVGTLRNVKAKLDFDLLGGSDPMGKALQRLYEDPALLADTLYVLCEKQCQERNISSEDFGYSLAGDAIEYATKAILDELIAFLPEKKRQRLKTVVSKLEEAESMGLKIIDQKISEELTTEKLQAAASKWVNQAMTSGRSSS